MIHRKYYGLRTGYIPLFSSPTVADWTLSHGPSFHGPPPFAVNLRSRSKLSMSHLSLPTYAALVVLNEYF